MRVICNAISETLFYHWKDPKKPRVYLFRPTGISSVNIGGNTIHSTLGAILGTQLLGLNDKSKAALRRQHYFRGSIINNRSTFYGIEWFMEGC